MIFTETALPGAYIVDIERLPDERGFFARTWCSREARQRGLDRPLAQCNISHNTLGGTLRGMHLQLPPFAEAKLVRCTRGAIYDVIIDLRRDSATYMRWVAVELSAENRRALFIPEGFAHGFQCLADDTEVFYQMSEFYAPEYARGVRWDDPAFAIAWPLPVRVISPKDAALPDFNSADFSF